MQIITGEHIMALVPPFRWWLVGCSVSGADSGDFGILDWDACSLCLRTFGFVIKIFLVLFAFRRSPYHNMLCSLWILYFCFFFFALILFFAMRAHIYYFIFLRLFVWGNFLALFYFNFEEEQCRAEFNYAAVSIYIYFCLVSLFV